MRVRADFSKGGPAEAMKLLESKLPSLKGRRFYGAFRLLPGGEEYFACVERTPSDNPDATGLDTGTIPGGLYVRRKVPDWETAIAEGKLGQIFDQLVREHEVDPERPAIEYYRSQAELQLFVPVLRRGFPAP